MEAANFEYWLELLFRRRVIALKVAAVVMTVVVAITLLTPPLYQSTAKVLIQENRAQLLVSPGLQNNAATQPSTVSTPVTEQDLNSERDLLVSPYIIAQALAGLPLPETSSGKGGATTKAMRVLLNLPAMGYHVLHATPEQTALDQWVNEVSRRLSSWVIRRSNLIEVDFISRDPKWASEFLTRLLDRYLDLHAGLTNDPAAERFFQAQAQVLQERLHRSEERLRGLELQTGITDVIDQRQKLTTELASLQDDYNKTQAELSATMNEIDSLTRQDRATPQVVAKETREEQNQALQTLKPEVMRLEAERAELLSRYQPNSARIKEIEAKLNAAKEILQREDRLEVQESSTTLNPVWIAIETNLKAAQAKASALEARKTALTEEIRMMRGKLDSFINDGIEIERAQQQVQTDREAYLSYLRKGEEARASHLLNQSKILNVSVAQPPSRPVKPISPQIRVNLLTGLLLAVILGFAAACWEEWCDPKAYSPLAIKRATGFNTIAVVYEQE
jgi:uncharacterized protein involved in exopolysaccharide biosynthesis